MMNLKLFAIKDLFDEFEQGKGPGLNHLVKTDDGIPYIGATNRNNGVLCYVKKDAASAEYIQSGNCIGFIKNGDGSAGYAIYKSEDFISTSDVIYGYADWLNKYTGLFFVTAQDMIEDKYSHGYKRNKQHLFSDRVILPATDDGKPDFDYMEEYVRKKRESILEQYIKYATARLRRLGKPVKIKKLSEKDWNEYIIETIFDILPGKRLVAADSVPGDRPFIGASDKNNGITRFCGDENASMDRNVLGINYNGSVGSGFYHPYECIFSDDVKRFHLKDHEDNEYVLLFMEIAISAQSSKFGYAYKFNAERMSQTKFLLPVNEEGSPDYEYMEQYVKNIMICKYERYIQYLQSK